jgi:hypothetical protein
MIRQYAIVIPILLIAMIAAILFLREAANPYHMTEEGAEAFMRVTYNPSDRRGGDVSVTLIHHPQDEDTAFAIYTISGYLAWPFARSWFLRWQNGAWELKQPPLLWDGTIGISSEFHYEITLRSFDCEANTCWLEIHAENDTHGMGQVNGMMYNPILRSSDNGDTWQWWHSEREAWVSDPRELFN